MMRSQPIALLSCIHRHDQLGRRDEQPGKREPEAVEHDAEQAHDWSQKWSRREPSKCAVLLSRSAEMRDMKGCGGTVKYGGNGLVTLPQTGALTELRYAPKPYFRAVLDIHAQAVETSHHRPGAVYSLARVSTRLQASSSSIRTLERFRIELRRSRLRLAARGVPPALRGLGGDVGNLVRSTSRRLVLVVGDASVIHHETRPVLAQDLLHTPDGVAIVVEQEADAAQKLPRPRAGNSAGRRRASWASAGRIWLPRSAARASGLQARQQPR